MKRRGVYHQPTVRVVLSCGHAINTRTAPLRENSTYMCRQGLGCGYSLPWVTWEDKSTNRSGVNYSYRERKGEDG